MGAVGYLVKLSQFPPMDRVANRIANTFNFSPHSGQQHPGRRGIGWGLVYEGGEGVHFDGISSEGQPNDDTRIIRASPEDAGFGMYLYWTGISWHSTGYGWKNITSFDCASRKMLQVEPFRGRYQAVQASIGSYSGGIK